MEQNNDQTLEQLKTTADALNAGRPEEEVRRELLAMGMQEETIEQYMDIAVRYNDLTYRRTGIKFFFFGLGLLVVGILMMLASMWWFRMAVWPHYVLLGCVAAAGVNLVLGFWRVVLHKNPRAEAAAQRMRAREDNQSPQEEPHA